MPCGCMCTCVYEHMKVLHYGFFFLSHRAVYQRRFLWYHQSQVPAKPNYSLVLYYASDRPINKDSLLAKFLDGSDAFRDSRFKLIPSIVEVCDS